MSTKSDIDNNNFIINKAPKNIRPFLLLARIDRPIGVFLLYIPTLWGLMASAIYNNINLFNTIGYAILFFIGSVVMRGAGCTWNDITDVKFDRQVERTKNRPLANNTISKTQAYIFLFIQLLIGASTLLFLPINSVIVAFMSIIPVIIYPFMKRFTYYPQAWLGLTFNWGVWVGWFVFDGGNIFIPLLLHIAGICWTLAYDTIYAHQDKEDDMLIGVKSTALKFGEKTKLFLTVFYALVILIFYIISIILNAGNMALIAILISAIMFITYILILDINNSSICLKIFKHNMYAGIILGLSLLM
ncbi:MAG: 4-hydroxybenzoate octaprenyltransferase [Alphaproteobacteria bacterium]